MTDTKKKADEKPPRTVEKRDDVKPGDDPGYKRDPEADRLPPLSDDD